MIDINSESPGFGSAVGIVIGNAFFYGMIYFRISECMGMAAEDAMNIGIFGSCLGIIPGTAVAMEYQGKRDELLE